jgi:hypothetical protein
MGKNGVVLTRITFEIDKIKWFLRRESVVELFGNLAYKAWQFLRSIFIG